MTEPLRTRSQPHILSLVDGRQGHYDSSLTPRYCIARRCPRGDWPEFWTRTRQSKYFWSNSLLAGTIYHNLEEAYQALTKAQRTGNTPNQ